jgi:hypothetical protein
MFTEEDLRHICDYAEEMAADPTVTSPRWIRAYLRLADAASCLLSMMRSEVARPAPSRIIRGPWDVKAPKTGESKRAISDKPQ